MNSTSEWANKILIFKGIFNMQNKKHKCLVISVKINLLCNHCYLGPWKLILKYHRENENRLSSVKALVQSWQTFYPESCCQLLICLISLIMVMACPQLFLNFHKYYSCLKFLPTIQHGSKTLKTIQVSHGR